MTDIKEVFARNLQESRKAAGLTQTALAEKLNYSDKAVSKWERGESIPDVVTLKQIADLFGVTVDYLITEGNEHVGEELKSSRVRKNRMIITLLAVALVWLIATVVFVCLTPEIAINKNGWMAFVYAVPVSMIVTLVFNSIWGKAKYTFLIVTILMWSTLAAVYLSLFAFAITNLWMLFIIGVPGQIIIWLWSNLKIKN